MPHSLVERVASRHRMAAFIPDKFFKYYEAQFKKLAVESVESNVLERVPFLIHDRVIPLYGRFIKELADLAPSAQQTLQERLKGRVGMLETLAESYSLSRRAVAAPYPTVTPLDHVLLHIQTRISLKLEKDLPTLGKALKQQVVIDGAKLKALADRAIKKASREDLDALTSDDGRGLRLERKYTFLGTHVDGSIPRLVKKQKVEIDWGNWFSWIRDILLVNYTKEAPLTAFDLNGMKVVVDDSTVTSEQQALYVKYMDVAYNLLKKRLGRAWYGTTFIKCDDCGGVSHNTGGDVGGHYHIRPDTVSVYVRPSKFVTELMVHELGHRYWFKSMSQGQRARFESLVRVHKDRKPEAVTPRVVPVSSSDLVKAKGDVSDIIQKAVALLEEFPKKPITFPLYRMVDRFDSSFWNGTELYKIPPRFTFHDDETDGLYEKARKSMNAVTEAARLIEPEMDAIHALPETEQVVAFLEARIGVVEAMKDALVALHKDADKYLERTAERTVEAEVERVEALERLNKQRQVDWDQDPREVLPVSDYGGTNIDEAFAEVFAYYVLDLKMNADQEASFKAVLLDKDRMAAKVAERWLEVYQ